MKILNLVYSKCFWNNLHKDWNPNNIKKIFGTSKSKVLIFIVTISAVTIVVQMLHLTTT